ncbi:MAG: alpha/beta hydrolase [Bacteroidia bacterium]|nr:alpha/beta hydrolase [Bacteroidia bacterium]
MVEVKTVLTERFEMDYISFGSGPGTLVLIPGMSLRSVLLQREAVAGVYKPFWDRYTIYLFDRVRDVREGYTIKDMADDTAAAMQALGLSSVHMIGHSQGGMIAMHIAAGYPELVGKLVLSSTSAFLNDGSRSIMEKWSAMAAGDDVAELNRSMFGTIYSDEYLSKYKQAFEYLENLGTRKEMDRLKVFTDACLTHDAREALKAIRCPVFILCSARDRIFPSSDSEYMAAVTGARLYVYEGYSHAVYDEAPDFKSRMLGFLTE